MKTVFKKASGLWSAFHELAMAPIAFVVFALFYALVAWLWQEIPLPGPSRLLGPMFGAFLVFVGWAAGTFSFYWNCKERFFYLFKHGPDNVFQLTEDNEIQLQVRKYTRRWNEIQSRWMSVPDGFNNEPRIEIETNELFRCHVLYLWHCSIFVFGLVLSQ
jgi:hypothetical protein